ncbi:MAG: hypothetical protein ACOCQR_03560 [bacterium]
MQMYMCSVCFQEYIDWEVDYKLEDGCLECSASKEHLVPIDELILPVIQELNYKGYTTLACCAGHAYDGIPSTYILFPIEIYSFLEGNFPKDFKIEVYEEKEGLRQVPSEDGYRYEKNIVPAHFILRKYYGRASYENRPLLQHEIMKSLLKLYQWVKTLPRVKKESKVFN